MKVLCWWVGLNEVTGIKMIETTKAKLFTDFEDAMLNDCKKYDADMKRFLRKEVKYKVAAKEPAWDRPTSAKLLRILPEDMANWQ